jgi:hypothetical protein
MYGVVRDIFVKIGQDQQEFEHTVTLFRARFLGAFFQVFHRGERVGEQPFKTFFAQRNAFTATRKGLIGANEGFIEKMIQTQLGAEERGGSRIRAACAVAMDGSGGCHFLLTSTFALGLGPKDAGEISIFILEAKGSEF